MYQSITALQYERLRCVMPVIYIEMVDGQKVQDGIALAEEVCINRFGTVLFVAFRINDQYYWTRANIRRRNHHYITRYDHIHYQSGYRARSVPDDDCISDG